jgi:C-terminal processing protease CtpA/Prc
LIRDTIISAQKGDVVTDFYGKELMKAVGALAGTPGTYVTVQVMRKDPSTGEYQPTEITITRQQLWMEGERDEEDKKP